MTRDGSPITKLVLIGLPKFIRCRFDIIQLKALGEFEFGEFLINEI